MLRSWTVSRWAALVGLALGLLAVVPLGVADHTRNAFAGALEWTWKRFEAPLFSVELESGDPAAHVTIQSASHPEPLTEQQLEASEKALSPPVPENLSLLRLADGLAAPEEEQEIEAAAASDPLAFPLAFPVSPAGPVPPGSVIPITNALSTPMFTTYLPGDERIFVVERAGRIKIIKNGMIQSPVFLDINARVGENGEEGMLSMAFDPNFAMNGRFYVFYSADPGGATRLSRFEVDSDPNVADVNSEVVMLTIPQPFLNHKGGTIAFSPIDKFLYVGIGDGGGTNDPDESAQNGNSLLGKMLRLNVSGNSAVAAAGNPFLTNPNVHDMIWALGFRNPFRWSFDSANGDIWIGDVGQDSREEIDYEPVNSPGRNYGWDVREGDTFNLNDPASPPYINGPPGMSFVEPIRSYDHPAGRCSVTGGTLYHGSVAALADEYLFADWCSGEMWSYHRTTGIQTDHTTDLSPAAGQDHQIVAISEGAFKEVYVVHLDGDLYRIGNTGTACNNGQDEDGDGLMNFPADPGCSAASDPSELNSNVPCDDGFDNDRDGAIDFPDDPGCSSPNSGDEVILAPDCDDDIDNDNDGATDFPDDPGCLSATTGSEDRVDPDCNDGIDNDGDGRTDFPADPGCTSATTGSEAGDQAPGAPGGGGGSKCGLGFELIFVMPPLLWLRQRRLRR